eukprot:1847930-Rhodomonas_salina.1
MSEVPVGQVSIGSEPAPPIFTHSEDKLAQLEVYYATENTDSGGTCQHCHGGRSECTPLSRVEEGRRRIE